MCVQKIAVEKKVSCIIIVMKRGGGCLKIRAKSYYISLNALSRPLLRRVMPQRLELRYWYQFTRFQKIKFLHSPSSSQLIQLAGFYFSYYAFISLNYVTLYFKYNYAGSCLKTNNLLHKNLLVTSGTCCNQTFFNINVSKKCSFLRGKKCWLYPGDRFKHYPV